MLQSAASCVYCEARPNSIEHMPPIGMFANRHRPSGLEFPACMACNNGTRAADAATAFIARIRPFHGDASDPLVLEARRQTGSLEQLAPGIMDEVFGRSRLQNTWVRGPEGFLQHMVRVDVQGPILAGLLTTFAAKLGMALYHEHVGAPLGTGGSVFVQPYLNAGLSQEGADAMLRILPAGSHLQQGRFEASEQFHYRYNCDDQSIFMALASFHANLHFMVLATAEPDTYRQVMRPLTCAEVAFGGLLTARTIPTLAWRDTSPLPGA